MDLALATGHGLPAISDLEARAPLILAEDVVMRAFATPKNKRRMAASRFPARCSRSTSPWSARPAHSLWPSAPLPI
jgi:hypothetical protein